MRGRRRGRAEKEQGEEQGDIGMKREEGGWRKEAEICEAQRRKF